MIKILESGKHRSGYHVYKFCDEKNRTSAALVAICALISVPLSNSAYADGPPLDQEVWKKSQSLRPQPSTETAPVVVTVASITYRIPRNCLTFMPIPTIKVTIPGYAITAFKPLTEETRDCFGSILQGQQAAILLSLNASSTVVVVERCVPTCLC